MRRRAKELPQEMRRVLVEARRERGWSQAELGRQVGLPQMHISAIENGRVVPRFDTLQNLVRVLGFELLLAPRQLVPIFQALDRDHRNRKAGGAEAAERPLYEPDEATGDGETGDEDAGGDRGRRPA